MVSEVASSEEVTFHWYKMYLAFFHEGGQLVFLKKDSLPSLTEERKLIFPCSLSFTLARIINFQ